MSENKSVSISEDLYTNVEVFAKKMNLSVNEVAERLIREGMATQSTVVYKEQDENTIKERLQSLGYID